MTCYRHFYCPLMGNEHHRSFRHGGSYVTERRATTTLESAPRTPGRDACPVRPHSSAAYFGTRVLFFSVNKDKPRLEGVLVYVAMECKASRPSQQQLPQKGEG